MTRVAFSLCSRCLLVSALACAAVAASIMSSDTARATPIIFQVENGVKRSPYTPYSQYRSLSPGLLVTKTGLQTQTATVTSEEVSNRGTWSIINRPSNHQPFPEDSFGYKNIAYGKAGDYGHHGIGDARPENRFDTPQQRGQTGGSIITQKSSLMKSAGPLHQNSSPPQVWVHKDAQKNKDLYRGDSPRMAGSTGNHQSGQQKTVWKSYKPSFFSSQTGGYPSSSLPTARGQYGDYKGKNQLTRADVHRTSNGIQSSKFLFASQSFPEAPSISKGLDTPAVKRDPRPEKLTSSVTDFSQGLYSVRKNEPKEVLSKNSQASFVGRETGRTVSGDGLETSKGLTPVTRRVSSNLNHLRDKQDPMKAKQILSDNAIPLHYKAQNSGQPQGLMKHQPFSGINTPAPLQLSSNVASGKSTRMQSSVKRNGEKSAASHSMKSIYGFKGFQNSWWPTVKENKEVRIPSNRVSNRKTNFQPKGSDKSEDYALKIVNTHPSSLRKYSFTQRTLSKSGISKPKNPLKSPGRVETTTQSTFQEVWPLIESDCTLRQRPDHKQLMSYRGMCGMEGFGTTASGQVEGARTVVRGTDKPTSSLEGLIQKWPDQTVESTPQLNEPSLKKGHVPDKKQIYNLMGFQSVQKLGNLHDKTKWKHEAKQMFPSAYLRSALTVKGEFEPNSVAKLSTSNMARGRRVNRKYSKNLNESAPLTNSTTNLAIVRLQKGPAKVKAIIYADIIGGASFSGVAATTQRPVTDKPNTTAASRPAGTTDQFWMVQQSEGEKDHGAQTRKNVSFPAPAENDEPSTELRENETSHLFDDNEGSGSGSLDPTVVLSADTREREELGEDLLESDYLRISTGNVSFKSMKRSHSDQ